MGPAGVNRRRWDREVEEAEEVAVAVGFEEVEVGRGME